MTGEQVEYTFMLCGFAFATLAGYGAIPFGDGSPRKEQAKRTFRFVGPLGLVCMGLLLIMSFAK